MLEPHAVAEAEPPDPGHATSREDGVPCAPAVHGLAMACDGAARPDPSDGNTNRHLPHTAAQVEAAK